MYENWFHTSFFEGGDLKIQFPWSLKGVNIGITLLCTWRLRKCEVLIIFCVERSSEEGQVNKLWDHLISIDPHIKFTIELLRTDRLPFLDTLTKPTPSSIESTVYRKATTTEKYLDYNSNQTISPNHMLSKPSSTYLNKYVLHLNFLQKKWITFTKSYKTTTTQHNSFNRSGLHRKPTESQTHPQEGS